MDSSWQVSPQSLRKEFVFADFRQAFQFMVDCAIDIEKLNHHPSWKNIYNRIEVILTTHDAGNVVTEKDHQLAAAMDLCESKLKGKYV